MLMAGLYGGAAGTAEDALVLLVPAVGFRSGYRYRWLSLTLVLTPPALFTVWLLGHWLSSRVRAWDAGVAGVATYEAAAALVSDP